MTTVLDTSARPSPARTIATWLGRRPDFVWSPPGWLAVTSVVMVFAVHTFVAWGADEPMFRADEVGNLGNALTFAQGGRAWVLNGSGYMPGLGLLLAPVWWLTDDPVTVYHAALAVGVLIVGLTVLPLAAVARRLGASRHAAVILASVVLVAPARTIPSNYILGEGLTTLAAALTVAAAFRFAGRPGVANGAYVGLASTLVFLGHGRGIAVVVAVGVWALFWLGRSLTGAIAMGATALAGSIGAYALYGWMVGELYWNDERLALTFAGSARGLADYAGTVTGLAWYAVAAWPAVVVLGLAVSARRTRRAGAGLLVLLALAASVAMAAIQLDKAGDGGSTLIRIDAWFYGRYIDHLLTVIALMGLVVLVRLRWPAVSLGVVAAVAAVSAAFFWVTVPQMPAGGYWVDVHVPGVSHLLSLDNSAEGRAEPWLLIILASVALTVLVLVAAMIKSAGALVLVLYFGALSIADDALRVDPRDENYRVWTAPIQSANSALPDSAVLGIDYDYSLFINTFVFPSMPRLVYPTNLEGDTPADMTDRVDRVDAVYSMPSAERPRELGARQVVDSRVGSLVLWVFPGDVQDALDAQGRLVPDEGASG